MTSLEKCSVLALLFAVAACDSPEGLALSAERKANYDRLVRETGALFGARPYESYRFLYALSDNIAHCGLEHHTSSCGPVACPVCRAAVASTCGRSSTSRCRPN